MIQKKVIGVNDQKEINDDENKNIIAVISEDKFSRSYILKEIAKLSLPIAAIDFVESSRDFIVSVNLAAAGEQYVTASSLIFSVKSFLETSLSGIFIPISFMSSMYKAQRDEKSAGSLLQQGYLISVMLSGPVMILMWQVEPILNGLGQDSSLTVIVKEFFRGYLWSVPAAFAIIVDRQFSNAVGKQLYVLGISSLGTVILAGSSYGLTQGLFGLPKLGVVGTGLSFTIQAWSSFLIYKLLFIINRSSFAKYGLFTFRDNGKINSLKTILKFGLPIVLEIGMQLSGSFLTILFLGSMHPSLLAVQQVVSQWYLLALVPIYALGPSASILVARAYAANENKLLRRYGDSHIILASVTLGVVMILFTGLADQLGSVFIDPNQYAAITNMLRPTFAVAGVLQIITTIGNISEGVLRGLCDTFYPACFNVSALWMLSVPLSYVFSLILNGKLIGLLGGFGMGALASTSILLFRWCYYSSMAELIPRLPDKPSYRLLNWSNVRDSDNSSGFMACLPDRMTFWSKEKPSSKNQQEDKLDIAEDEMDIAMKKKGRCSCNIL